MLGLSPGLTDSVLIFVVFFSSLISGKLQQRMTFITKHCLAVTYTVRELKEKFLMQIYTCTFNWIEICFTLFFKKGNWFSGSRDRDELMTN